MNRMDRLYAVVEQLRTDPGRPKSAAALARHFEVSMRTIERDVRALQEAGVPIYAETGRRGGYLLDRRYSLPPLNVEATELVALALAATTLAGTPLHRAACSAVLKVMAGMPEPSVRAARWLAARVRMVGPVTASRAGGTGALPDVPLGRVVSFDYTDRHGVTTRRELEPTSYVLFDGRWYVAGWCRLRDDVRHFRLDRMSGLVVTGEPAGDRDALVRAASPDRIRSLEISGTPT
jgi:predicted DNA-binding transcriptional regulator YafY